MTTSRKLILHCAALLLAMACGTTLAADAPIKVSAESFSCITKLTPVRGFYVGNLLGAKALQETLKVARNPNGGTYPPGSVVQLIPIEAMVKQPAGTSPATKDWEFFELDVKKVGTTIAHRGYTDVVNRFGGNCLGCHAAAKPQWDMVCEESHGCAPVPLTRPLIEALQRSDARCNNTLSAQDQAELKAFGPLPPPKP